MPPSPTSPTSPTLRGPRALLRPIRRDDRAALAAILAEPDVARWWIHGDLESTVAGLYDEPGSVPLTIEVDGEVAGYIQFSEDIDPDYRHATLDLFLSTAWQGRGLGPEAIRLVARHLFEERGHHRITIDPAAANERAIRAYEKLGFRRVGIMRAYERGADGTWRDGLLMDLLRDELIEVR
ncbi:MAG: GNAT family N-acetyltransferase [Anaerolinea sp.]|jgi:aminoglycoside 6'-N-acetyltransferase|nr:GNAT family N-acetyltransferase [Anaerolinea sp.]